MAEQLVIGVTDCSKYQIYHNWVQSFAPSCKIIKLGADEGNKDAVKQCSGIVFTGGEDVHPRFYNKPEYLPYCYPDDINEKRDEFELALLQYTQDQQVPVLGICRGLQLANVFFGGTLIPDIPTWGRFNHGKLTDGADRYHPVSIDPDSWLCSLLANTVGGDINSNHHQSADSIGKGLVVNALSPDGVVEGLERIHAAGAPFLGLVQWHPERINKPENPFRKHLGTAFLKALKQL
ncbi:gamma-glutamyl-gamma-aminobutyrate hydrolase family protein [Chitinophaga defluvii]|uniref:Gamma-glutamyl-gamma-aminobutyrate hydrolase family protein n=1 Tax=Chitinophaga defluvii TaxID=3163343 RepID=A0ABV2T4R8_9BACT